MLARNDVRIERFYGHGLRTMSECEFSAFLFYHKDKAYATFFAPYIKDFLFFCVSFELSTVKDPYGVYVYIRFMQ